MRLLRSAVWYVGLFTVGASVGAAVGRDWGPATWLLIVGLFLVVKAEQ